MHLYFPKAKSKGTIKINTTYLKPTNHTQQMCTIINALTHFRHHAPTTHTHTARACTESLQRRSLDYNILGKSHTKNFAICAKPPTGEVVVCVHESCSLGRFIYANSCFYSNAMRAIAIYGGGSGIKFRSATFTREPMFSGFVRGGAARKHEKCHFMVGPPKKVSCCLLETRNKCARHY